MLSNCIKVTSKNNLINKYYSILIYDIQKQNKNTSDHDQSIKLILFLISQNMSYYSWMITAMKNVNNFQIPKVQPQSVAQHLLDKKSVAYIKKACISSYSVQMRENTNQKNSEYGHLSRSNILFDFLKNFRYIPFEQIFLTFEQFLQSR